MNSKFSIEHNVYKDLLKIAGVSILSKCMQLILVGYTYTVITKVYGVNGLAEYIIVLSLVAMAGVIMSSIQPEIIKNIIDRSEKRQEWLSLKRFLLQKETLVMMTLGYLASVIALHHKTESAVSTDALIKMAFLVVVINSSILCDSYFVRVNRISFSHIGQIVAATVTIPMVFGVEQGYLNLQLIDLTFVYIGLPSLIKLGIYVIVKNPSEKVNFTVSINNTGFLILSGVMGYLSGVGLPAIISEYMGSKELVKLGTAMAIFNQVGSFVPLVCSYFWPKIAKEKNVKNNIRLNNLLRQYYACALIICISIFIVLHIYGGYLLKIWMPSFGGFQATEWGMITIIMNLYVIQTFLNYRVYSKGRISNGAKISIIYTAVVVVWIVFVQPISLNEYLLMQAIVLLIFSIVPLIFVIKKEKQSRGFIRHE